MENYKGIYYYESKEKNFYEGGAHFRYKDLFKALISLGGMILDEEYHYFNTTNNENIDILSLSKINKDKKQKQKIRTRNIVKLNYVNNPNTQIKFNDNKFHKKNYLSKNDINHFIPRNNTIFANNNFFDNKINNNNCSFNLANLNTKRNISNNNNLIKAPIYKKVNKSNIIKKMKFNYIINNDNKKINIFNYLKYIHQRNKSDNFINYVNTNNYNKIYSSNNININNLTNSYEKKIFNYNKNYNIVNNNKNIETSKDQSLNNKKQNNLMVYNKSQANINKFNTEFNFTGKKIKKSRNIMNKNKLTNRNTMENNEIIDFSGNSTNNIFLNELREINTINNYSSFVNFTNNPINNTNNINNNINDNIVLSPNKIIHLARKINHNGKIMNNKIVLEKYIRKKINIFPSFDKNNNSNKKNGGKNLSRNMNNTSFKFSEKSLQFKTSSSINNINKYNFGKE